MATNVNDPGKPRGALRLLDLGVAVLGLAIALFLALRRPSPWAIEYANGRIEQSLLYGTLLAILFVLLLLARRPGRLAILGRITAYLLLVLGVLAAWSRAIYVSGYANFPPDPGASMSGQFGDLTPKLRARWGAIVAAHRIGTTLPFDAAMKLRTDVSAPSAISIPTTWLFPPDVQIATERGTADTLWIWARTSDGTVDCVSLPERRKAPLCDAPRAAAPAMVYAFPSRVQELTPTDARDEVGGPWPQYRGDAAKNASAGRAPVGTAWRFESGTQYRSTASAVGPYVLIGSHGTGDILALDVMTGQPFWRSRAANWVHQDITSDGRIAIVGFGDNFPSTWGRAPSGVSAYALKTGKLLWTHFDEASVMTSPLIYGETIVYGTNAGIVRQRSLATGDVIASARIPWGGVTMAPPAMIGDTAIFTVDIAWACAMQLPSLKTLWCQHIKGAQLAGHSAAAVGNGLVIGSNPVGLNAITFSDWFRLPFIRLLRVLWSQVWVPGLLAGQQMYALDLHTGVIRWRSRIFSEVRDVTGHGSGTPTLTDSIGVVVLPSADTLVSFRIADGSVRWTAGAHQSRGPVTIVDNKVVLSGGDGITEVRDLQTGTVTCTMRRAVGYDRSGPTRVGDMFIFADLKGLIESVPVDALLTCDSARLVDRSPPTGAAGSTMDRGH